MDTCEATARLVNNTYRNVIEELGPCIKQLVVAGRTYLKSIHGMVAAHRNYNEALSRVANLADSSTLRGSSYIGAALHHLVDINKEFQAQQSNIMKSLEFDFLEPMEIAADKDTKLVGREQKRFQQLHKGRKEIYEKSIATLKKSRRKKSINTDKQLAQMKMLESAKSRLEEFCDEGLKEAIVQERMMYGTVLERQCAFNKQLLIYHNKGCELLQDNIPHWEALANSRDVLPDNCFPLHPVTPRQNDCNLYTIESDYDQVASPVESVTLRSTGKSHLRECDSMISTPFRLDNVDNVGIYARPLVRAKSEYNLSSSTSDKPATPPSIFGRLVEYNGEMSRNYVKAIYPYQASGEYQMVMAEGDIIGFIGPPNATGWQFGDNMTSKRSGWFPLSYTEPIKNGDSSPLSSRASTIVDENYDSLEKRPMPYHASNVRSPPAKSTCNQGTSSDSSDYGTLKRFTPKKLLPVEPPISPVIHQEISSSRSPPLRGRSSLHHSGATSHYPFQIDNDQPLVSKTAENRTIYTNVPLQSMHL